MELAYLVAAILLLLIIFGILAALAIARRGEASPDFVAKTFLTPNEMEFLQRLETALPEMRIHAQVAMGALLDPAVRRGEDASRHSSVRNRFAQKICDFVLQSRKTGKVVAIVELDDRTHRVEKDASRDAMTAQAGYRTIRWQSKSKPSHDEIRAKVMGGSQAGQGLSVTPKDRISTGPR